MHLEHDFATWQAIERDRVEPDEYRAHVLECYGAARAQIEAAGGYPYNADAWPLAAAMMADRHGYPDAREASAPDGVARAFGSHCYSAGCVLDARRKRERERAAAARFIPGQIIGRATWNDGKLCTGIMLQTVSADGAECRLTGKRAGRGFEWTCDAYSLQCAIERAAERAGLLAERRKRAKPAPCAPPATHTVAEAQPEADPVPTHSEAGDSAPADAEIEREAQRDAECAARLADDLARLPRGARVTSEPATDYQGRAVPGWPSAQFLGTVRESFDNRGSASVRVKWDSGRVDLQSADRLTVLPVVAPLPVESAPLDPLKLAQVAEFMANGCSPKYRAMGDAITLADATPADPAPLPGDTSTTAPATMLPGPTGMMLAFWRRQKESGQPLRPVFAVIACAGAEQPAGYCIGWTADQAHSERQASELPGFHVQRIDPPADAAGPCRHPPARLYAGHAKGPDGIARPWVACCDCGDVLAGGATREPDPLPADVVATVDAMPAIDAFDYLADYTDAEPRSAAARDPAAMRAAVLDDVRRTGPEVFRDRMAEPEPDDDDETIPAQFDGLDVAELGADGLAEFERAGGTLPEPTAPAYSDAQSTQGPSLRIPATDPRARIPARFAPVYVLRA